MKVILIEKVLKGNVGDVINVNNGYARNYLIPQKKAINFSEENYKFFQEKKKQFEEENINKIKDAQKIQDVLLKKCIIVIENASDEGRLYGSVSTSTVANKINELLEKNIIKRAQIIIKKPIKDIGLHYITVNLHPEVIFDMQLAAARTEEEAKSLLNKDKGKDKEVAAKEKEEEDSTKKEKKGKRKVKSSEEKEEKIAKKKGGESEKEEKPKKEEKTKKEEKPKKEKASKSKESSTKKKTTTTKKKAE